MKNEILTSITKVCEEYIGNSNSLHSLGTSSKKLENAASNQIISVLELNNKEIIYTSGECESNNLLIFGLLEKYKNKEKNVIINKNVHDSITLSLKEFSNIKIKYIETTNDLINIDELNNLIDENTILISLKNIKNVNNLLKKIKNYNGFIHYDLSNENNIFTYNNCDFLTIEDNQLPGFGCLIKNKNIYIEPIFHGGKSTTIYRSGTPALPLIVGLSKLIKIKYKK